MTGTVPLELYSRWRMIARTWKCDVQEVEGINSMLSVQTARSPNISLPLLSSRTSIRKACGLGQGGSGALKWSHVAGRVQDLLHQASDAFSQVHTMHGDASRWVPVRAADGPQPVAASA
eukprot:7524776-Alexandrium_andersonii.AAC.1